MKILRPHEGSPYHRIVVDDNSHLSGEALSPYVEQAVELADAAQAPVHIQSVGEITHNIIFPEAA